MYRQLEKNVLNGNISSICLCNMVNFGPLTAEICGGTPANFNGFRILASSLQRRRSTEVNQTLHDVWPSPALVYYICIFGGSCPLTEFCQLQNFHIASTSPILGALLHCMIFCVKSKYIYVQQTSSADILLLFFTSASMSYCHTGPYQRL